MKTRITAEVIRKSGRGFVFCRTRLGVDRVAEELENEGLSVTSIHGGMAQRKRSQAVEEFGEGKTHAIVATDVAARGLDIKGVHCVVHFDPPENGKAFKHRSGRTARAGGSGNVISLVQNPQKGKWSKIQKEVGLKIKFSPPEFKDVIQHEDTSHIPSPSRRGGRNSRDRKDRRGRPNDGGDRGRDRKHYGRRNGNDASRGGGRGSGVRSGGRSGGRDGGRDGGRSGGRSGGGGKPRFNRNNRPPKGPGRSRGRGGDNKRTSRNNHNR
jgi:superfamily II DNA/RNA helicase